MTEIRYLDMVLFVLIIFLHYISPFLQPFTHCQNQSYKEAIDSPEWRSAIADELAALLKTNTWDLVPIPTNKNVIGFKWIF